MLHVSRNLVIALSATLVVALAGCGGDDKKTSSTASAPVTVPTTAATPPKPDASGLAAAKYTALNKSAERVVKDLAAIGKATTACSKSATSQSEVGTCVSHRLDKATDELNSLSASVRDVSTSVTGTCQTDLVAFADDIKDLGGAFKTASKALLDGNTTEATDALKNLPLEAVQTTGNAAQTTCKPG